MEEYLVTKFSAKGFGKNINEDAVETLLVDDGLLCILCDGVGSDDDPEIAPRIAINAFKNLFDSSNIEDYLQRIGEALFETNDFLLKYAQQKKNNRQITTTIEVLYLKNNFAYWGHIGDSRIYYFKGGNLRKLTKDHSLIQKLLDEGFLTLNQAHNHPSAHVILKALGKEKVEPDLSKMRLSNLENYKFFICSDGVTNLISDNEIQDILNIDDQSEIRERIISMVRSRGAADDYSFILVEKSDDRKTNP